MDKINVVFMGTPDFAVPILEELLESCNVIGVVCQPDKMVGRKREIVYSPIKKLAIENNIKVLQPIKVRIEYEDITSLKPDLIVTCAYGQIIPKELLDCPRLGCINVHASLLPKLRGGAPIHHAIIDGYDKTGITVMYMAEKMDDGDIISQSETKIEESDNLESLYNRLSKMGRSLLHETLPSIIDGTNKRIKQNDSLVTFGFNIKREEEHIDFNKNSREVFNLIRGISPVPSANMIIDDLEMKVFASRIGTLKGKPSTISCIYKDGFGVYTNDGEVIITDVKPFGKKRMSAASYLNGVDKLTFVGKEIK